MSRDAKFREEGTWDSNSYVSDTLLKNTEYFADEGKPLSELSLRGYDGLSTTPCRLYDDVLSVDSQPETGSLEVGGSILFEICRSDLEAKPYAGSSSTIKLFSPCQ